MLLSASTCTCWRKGHVSSWREGCCLQARKRALTGQQICLQLVLARPASRTERGLLLKLLIPWCFVTGAWADLEGFPEEMGLLLKGQVQNKEEFRWVKTEVGRKEVNLTMDGKDWKRKMKKSGRQARGNLLPIKKEKYILSSPKQNPLTLSILSNKPWYSKEKAITPWQHQAAVWQGEDVLTAL